MTWSTSKKEIRLFGILVIYTSHCTLPVPSPQYDIASYIEHNSRTATNTHSITGIGIDGRYSEISIPYGESIRV